MRNALSTYSGILQLNHETFVAIREASQSIGFALRLILFVGLIAGLGKVAGWRTVMAEPTIPERIDKVSLRVDQLDLFLAETVPARIPLGLEVLLSVEIEDLYYSRVDSFVAQLRGHVAQAQTVAAELAPPVGIEQSRMARLIGDWLATPFELLAAWALFALIALVLVKTLGGTGTLSEHLNLLALGAAPYVLLFFSYMPSTGPYALATQPLGKLFSLIATLWATAILIKALTVSHQISAWRAFGVVAVTAAIVFVLLPITTFFALAYILI